MRCLCLISMVLFSILVLGQCGTDFDPEVKKHYSSELKKNHNREAIQIPVKIHIIQTTSGFGGIDSASVIDALNIVNNKFSNAALEFYSCTNINYIQNSDYTYFIKNDSDDINDRDNALNIYFAPELVKYTSSDTISLCGYAYMSGSKDRIIMDNDCAINGTTLSHEVGHYFSLYHTHEDDFGDEFVSGINCETAGDLLCDTPADPKLSTSTVNSICMYTGTDTDPLGMQYSPDVHNLMAYGRKSCREYFSQYQSNQMNFYAQTYRNYLSCFPAGLNNNMGLKTIRLNYDNIYNYLKLTGLGKGEAYYIELLDMMGKRVFYKKLNSEQGINIESSIINQLFIVRVHINNDVVFNKMVLL